LISVIQSENLPLEHRRNAIERAAKIKGQPCRTVPFSRKGWTKPIAPPPLLAPILEKSDAPHYFEFEQSRPLLPCSRVR
jgi:hypothetical protein